VKRDPLQRRSLVSRQTHGVAHRDFKPSNLYEFDGKWLMGDFGLVAVPNVEELTRTGKPLGPAH
jgi:hypothetical protein